jgi:tRNA pseudouridine13 synthase
VSKRPSFRSFPATGHAALIEALLKLTPAELDARWPCAFGGPLGAGRIRAQAADFLVREISPVKPSGVGEHLWLLVRKTDCNTEWVAGALARFLARPRRDVGYAGRKDRAAVAEQWFSVRCPSRQARLEGLSIPGVTVLTHVWHDKKLKRGYLQGNRFSIRVREVDLAPADVEERLSLVTQYGAPNYFGLQRFGRGLSNLGAAVRFFAGAQSLGREPRSLALSAARSLLFNEILAERVREQRWAALAVGDMANLAGSRSVFPVTEVDEVLERRLRQLDIHPTAPLFGVPGRRDDPPACVGDQGVIDRFPELRDGLIARRVELAQRPTRLVVSDLSWELAGTDLRLEFSLPPGVFATAVLRELVSV